MRKIKYLFNEYVTLNNLVKSVLVPLVLLIIYCGTFAYLHSLFLNDGVNYFFAIRILKGASILAGAVIVLCLIIKIADRSQQVKWIQPPEKIQPGQIIILLFPLTPIVEYLFSNRNMLSFTNVLVIVGFFVLFCSIYILLIPIILRQVTHTRILMSLGTTFTYSLLNMASMSQSFSWLKFGSMKVQLPILVVIFLVAWVLLGLKNKKDLLLFVTLFFILNVGFFTLSNRNQEEINQVSSLPAPDEKTELQYLAEVKRPVRTPNIYLMIYDAYVTDETMRSYGIDNSEQEAYLESLGFVHYPQTYSIGADTINTMSRVLNASTSFLGGPRKAVSGSGVIQYTLKALGYETYGIFPYDYLFRDTTPSYDVAVPDERRNTSSYLISAVMVGEFRFDLFQIGIDPMTHEKYVEIKQDIFTTISDNVFIYSHSNLPNHSQNSGKCLPNEVQLYEERLQKANTEMRQDIDIILQNDPESIIIIAGDHGPYLTKNCMGTKDAYDRSEINRQDIQDRIGTFLAIKWPTGDFESFDNITVLQDIFPAILAYMYDSDEFLKYKVPPQTIYDVSGVAVNNGIIVGGINDGEPLFIDQ